MYSVEFSVLIEIFLLNSISRQVWWCNPRSLELLGTWRNLSPPFLGRIPEQQTRALRHPLNVPGSCFLGNGNNLVNLCSNCNMLVPSLLGNSSDNPDNLCTCA